MESGSIREVEVSIENRKKFVSENNHKGVTNRETGPNNSRGICSNK